MMRIMMRLLPGALLLGAVAAQDSKRPPPPPLPPRISLLLASARLEWPGETNTPAARDS